MLDLRDTLTRPPQPPPWLVTDFLCQGQIVVLAGDPGVGKSVLAQNLAMSIAGTTPFLGRATEHGHVMYFDEENALPDVEQYLKWTWHGLGCPPLATLEQRLHFYHFDLIRHATRFAFMTEEVVKYQPLLIVIDTATPACQITDENDNAEASRAIRQLRLVKQAAGPQCTVLILKHMRFTHNTKEQRTIRGAKTWSGECDAIIFHMAARGRPRKDGLRATRLIPEKVRAFGLRDELSMRPNWINEGERRGLVMAAEVIAQKQINSPSEETSENY